MMKFKGVLDGFRSTQQPKPEEEVVETLKSDSFEIAKTFLHGFPHQPTALAFDPVQRLLAIGTKNGSLRILGRPGVDSQTKHETEVAVLQIEFLINEGALITATSDDTIHLWNFRQKRPEIVHSLKFQKERITYMHLPLKSKWLYVGSERGNVHVINVESFALSGYVINWNKAIDLLCPTHPGPVVHLSDCPTDANKLLIGFESGQISLWNLKTKKADIRWQYAEQLKSISWHYEGKQFMCAHADGSLTTWNMRPQDKPVSIIAPHSKVNKDRKVEPACKPIQKVEWKTSKTGDSYIVFSGGTTYDTAGRVPSITVTCGKSTTVIEMEHNIVDFITLCENPYVTEIQEPYAIVILLQNDVVLIDLQTPGYPCFENPYSMDIHESPVTCCSYFADCPSDIIPALYSVGSRASQKRVAGFSENEWPLSGGEWSPTSCSYNEIIITGHADGSVKFWDASAGTLQVLYKLKTAKLFEKQQSRSVDGNEEDPFSIQLLSLCPESRKLAIAGSSGYVVVFKFRKLESISEISVLEIPNVNTLEAEAEFSPESDTSRGQEQTNGKKNVIELKFPVNVKFGQQKKPPGFQPHLVCLTAFPPSEPPFQITALSINSSYGLVAYGTENGVILVDFIQKCYLLNIVSHDLYGNSDPFQRAPKSPKRTTASGETSDGERCRSPSIDQCLDQGNEEQPEESCELNAATGTVPSELTCDTEDSPSGPQSAELAEDALAVLSDEAAQSEALTDVEEYPRTDRRASQLWKGFNLKKQLSKVDMKIKNTFAATAPPPEGRKERTNSIFYTETREGGLENEQSTGNSIPKIREFGGTPIEERSMEEGVEDDTEDQSEKCTVRPNELQLFDDAADNTGPQRPVRRKRFSLEKQPTRDTRLLSVPNIKYQQPGREKKYSLTQKTFLNLIRKLNKLDSTFSRSRSSSMSSLENVTSEAVQCLVFADSFIKKTDMMTVPTLWIGTSVGSIFNVVVNVPPAGETRITQPVTISPVGAVTRLKGGILTVSFLDCSGSLMKNTFDQWKDEGREKKTPTKTTSVNTPSLSGSAESVSVGSSPYQTLSDRQFVTIISEKQARVLALPSHECIFRQQIVDTDFVVKADVVSFKDSPCLLCYVSNGHVMAYGLPSLRLLMDVEFVPLSDLRIAKTFCFSNRGHGLYFTSPSEIQKFTVSADFCREMSEMVHELFLPRDMPEPPKQSLFKSLLGGGARSVDREELFGESSGKPIRSVAKHIPGPSGQIEQLQQKVSVHTGEVGRAHHMVVERGEKLGHLEERTQRMMSEAERFASSAHELMQKNKDKKWYQL